MAGQASFLQIRARLPSLQDVALPLGATMSAITAVPTVATHNLMWDALQRLASTSPRTFAVADVRTLLGVVDLPGWLRVASPEDKASDAAMLHMNTQRRGFDVLRCLTEADPCVTWSRVP